MSVLSLSAAAGSVRNMPFDSWSLILIAAVVATVLLFTKRGKG